MKLGRRLLRRIVTTFSAVMLAASTAVLATPDAARANDNPIDWTVVENYLGPFGNDVPLRVGQHDEGADPGFGRDHIVDAHGFVPPFSDIQQTLASEEFCAPVPGTDRVVCDNPDIQLVVVFATHVDPRSGDGRPFGIITAFYYLPCLAADGQNEAAVATLPCGVLPPPTVSAGPDASGVEGTAVALHGSATTSEVPLDSVSWSYSVVTADPGTTCHFADPAALNTTITCDDDGVFEVTLTANDGVNPAVSDSARVVLANAPPRLTLSGPAPWQVFRSGTPVTLTATATDAGNDTVTCSVTWDDGTQEAYPAAESSCGRTHTFAGAGMYTITLRATDDDGGTAAGQVMVVVYDPNAGHPTAGGWLDSPEGALTTNAAATGKATFQFNPQYQPGDPGREPSIGKVSFNFRSGNFSLDSTTLEWLVVTADGKAAVKGTAIVNGASGYGFVLYAYDEPDSLRLVVWQLRDGPTPGDTLVYDNVPGADFDLDSASPQPITHGAITIHT